LLAPTFMLLFGLALLGLGMVVWKQPRRIGSRAP
jgi:hypothetical protein